MNYSQLSDFEINKRVCDVFWPGMKKSSQCNNKAFPQNTSTVYMDNGYGGFSRDYCNNPADAWPIITANKISVYAMGEADKRGGWGAEAFHPNDAYSFNDNPLRAAMIVFLMMQDES